MKTRRYLKIGSHRGVLDAGIILLGVIVAIIAIVAATLAWSDILEVSYTKLIIEMPSFDYDVKAGLEGGNQHFEVYQLLRNLSLVILTFVLIFAGASFVFERLNWLPAETGYRILSKSVLYVFVFFFFPPLWDLVASTVEQTSLWLLNPDGITETPKNVEFLLTKLGGIESPEFTLDAIIAGISDPFGTLKNIFVGVFLATFKAVSFLIFMFITFLFGTIRLVLNAIIIVAIPLILMLSLLPFFKRITDRFIDALFGLMLAPIFSSLVLVAGVAHIQTLSANSPDPIVEWFAALAVMALSTFIPTILVPFLGSFMRSISPMITGAITTGVKMTGLAGLGVSHGIASLASGVRGYGLMDAGTNPLSLAKMAVSGSHIQMTSPSVGQQSPDKFNRPMHGPFGRLGRSDDLLSST